MTDKNTVFQQKLTVKIQDTLVDLSKPRVMGILNLTPDSFYDGGRHHNEDEALKQTHQMLVEGADFIDIGAYSSRPKADHISGKAELLRLIPTLKAIVKEFPKAIISVDTFRANIAEAAILEGAHIINDISAGELDKKMFETVAKLKVPYVIMHMKGTPQNMLEHTSYADVFTEVFEYFIKRIKILKEMGVVDLIIDPGFGFAKTPDQSFKLLNNLDLLKALNLPILAGLSRKSMIYKSLNITSNEALNATSVANTIALMKGANILRVHDVKPAVEAIKIVSKMNDVN